MARNNDLTKRILLKAFGIAVCVCPVCAAILSYFPLWVERADACVLSGLALCLILLAMIPFYKHLIAALRSPSAHLMWFIIFVIFFFLSRIAEEMTVISFVGFVSNLVGALIFKLERACKMRGRGDE